MKTLSSCTFAVLVTLLNPSQLVLAQASDLETLADSIAAEHVGSPDREAMACKLLLG
ncbi:MAG: hypothetical protein ACKVIB_08140 [Pseudomonadales bacterium]|jgi:hypothetical protein